MELNSEEVIKALECCCGSDLPNCHECPYKDNKVDCFGLSYDALALIKELTEENEKIGIENFGLICELSRIKEDTVREFAKRLKAELKDCCRYIQGNREYFIVGEPLIDQIAQEMYGGSENDT